MSVLKYLRVSGLHISDEDYFQLTCKAIACGLSQKRDVLVSTKQSIKVYSNEESKSKTEPLKLDIDRGGKNYVKKVSEFVKTIPNCSIVKEEFEDEEYAWADELWSKYNTYYDYSMSECESGDSNYTESPLEDFSQVELFEIDTDSYSSSL